ncbi:CrcB family protein [Winkia sp. ACRQY]|uniref:Fluoride-specific ion channel FluC n=1 Tax=Winkia neuii subsp. anitrata TaxID=29318 RepID=A0AB38XMA1_9ACTO|nr:MULTISPECIES: CrcB family protein [Winkia]PLB79707.1 fluoride efflux transporter CrcB [Actinomyces sp. UMB0138]MCG7302619.1 CrcB family protein [Winkia sp. ACRQY]MDK7163917.1 CrcB family protein [Winkia sp. UMB3105]MDK8595063.1 CrcB family protein [Winkia sp. UMB1096A]MDU2269976.1 CrcB family protein [Winkia neuii]
MIPSVMLLLGASLAGALGAVCRYCIDALTKVFWSMAGTVLVNMVGCFLIGIVAALSADGPLGASGHYLLATGFLGGFTTFSTAMLEAVNAIRGGKVARGLALAILPVILGLALCAAGIALVNTWL